MTKYRKYANVEDASSSTGIPDAPTRQPSPFKGVGAPGTAVYGGFVIENEKDPRVAGVRKYRTYSDVIANVAIVGAAIRLFLTLVAKADWHVQPADESKEAQKYADLVEDMMQDMVTPWHRIVRRAALFRFYGFSLQEWTAKRRDDGNIGLLDIAPRAQFSIFRWDVDAHGTVDGVVQLSPQTQAQIYLPRQKLVYMVDDSLNDSPEGLGILRHIVKAADKLMRFELLESWGYESDIRGIPLVRLPLTDWEDAILNASDDGLTAQSVAANKQVWLDMIEKHARNPSSGIIIDSKTYQSTDEGNTPSAIKKQDIELLRGEQGPHQEIHAAIERLTEEIARVLGAEHLLVGGSSKGSHAMVTDKTQSFGEMVDSTLVELRAGFKQDILRPLWRLNGWNDAMIPSFVTDNLQYRNVTDVTTALLQLAQAGSPMGPGDPAVNKVRSLLGLPDAPEIDESLIPLPQDSPAHMEATAQLNNTPEESGVEQK